MGSQDQSQGKALASHPGTVLDLCWTKVRYLHPFFVFFTSLGVRRASPEERFHGLHGCIRAWRQQRGLKNESHRSTGEIHTQCGSLFFSSRIQSLPLILRGFTRKKKTPDAYRLFPITLLYFSSSLITCRLSFAVRSLA